MVGILPSFDPGKEIGQSIGSGFGDALKLLGKRQLALSGLDKLKKIDEESFNKMSLPQQLAALQEPFAGFGEAGVIGSELLPTFLRERQRRAGAGISEELDGPNQSIIDAAKRQQELPVGEPSDPEITQQGPSVQGIPNNMPGQARQVVEQFPELRAMALRGNPQGLPFNEQARLVAQIVGKGGTYENAAQQVNSYSDYLANQSRFYQGIMDDVSQEAQKVYGESPMKNMFERSMMREADRQIDKGLLEPNSIRNIARQRAKNMETLINTARTVEGRPFFNVNLPDRKDKTASWLNPLIKEGEFQSAMELAMSRDLGVDAKSGQRIAGPDWGPVRASEIIQEAGNPQGVKRVRQFINGLEDSRPGSFASAPQPATSRQKAVDRNIKKITEFLSDENKFQSSDSLTLLRSYAKDRGIDEDEFSQALKTAKQNRDGEFSSFQNWEESTFLSSNIISSLTEILNGKKSVSDWFTGKK